MRRSCHLAVAAIRFGVQNSCLRQDKYMSQAVIWIRRTAAVKRAPT